MPNGALELSIKDGPCSGTRTLWRDGKRQRVEDCLGDFIAHLEVTADAIKRDRDEQQREILASVHGVPEVGGLPSQED